MNLILNVLPFQCYPAAVLMADYLLYAANSSTQGACTREKKRVKEFFILSSRDQLSTLRRRSVR